MLVTLLLIHKYRWFIRIVRDYWMLQTTTAPEKSECQLTEPTAWVFSWKLRVLSQGFGLHNVIEKFLSLRHSSCSFAASNSYLEFVATLVRDLDFSAESTFTSNSAGFPSFQAGTICLRRVINFLVWGSLFLYWWETSRWARRHYYLSNPVMSGNCVSSNVTRILH